MGPSQCEMYGVEFNADTSIIENQDKVIFTIAMIKIFHVYKTTNNR